MANGQPKPTFYVAVFVVILGLVGLALYRYGAIGTRNQTAQISGDELKQMQKGAEAPDASGITTKKEYNYVPATKLPEVKGISNYTAMSDRTVRFAINVWAGWAPIIYANNGLKAGKVWKTPSGKDFKVELVLIDDPVAMRDAYAAGSIQVGWATLDMVPLFMEGLRKDSRVMPRIYQQVDWSNGGDGIVVRDTVKTIADLRGKTVVLAQNSPSHFFVLNALINGGVQPAEVTFKFTQDAFQAAAAFNADKNLAGVVSWAPDIYNLEKVKGNKIIVNTATANKLIADVWFARADFAKDNPDIMEGIVRGIFDGMQELKVQDAKQKVSKLMASGYSIPESDALGMLGDAHSTNYAENREFFLNQNNPTNFERTWNTAYFLYKKINAVTQQTAFDQVMDFSIIQKLAAEPKYASQKNEYDIQFAPATAGSVQGEKDEILTKTVVIHFFPNSWDLNKKVTRTGRQRQGGRGALRPQRRVRHRGGRQARRAVWRRADRDRRPLGRVDARPGAEEPGAGAVAQPRELRQGGAGTEVPDAAAEPVLDRRHRLGSAGRRLGSGERGEEPPGRGQGLPGRVDDREVMVRPRFSSLMDLRQATPQPLRSLAGVLTMGIVLLVWWFVTSGSVAEERIVSPAQLPSPVEVIRSFPSLLNERNLVASIAASMRRVLVGFALAIVVGVPLGVLSGSWRVFEAGGAPFALFGRNVPIAALIPLTLMWFGIDETQKVMFIFIACVPFVYSSTVTAIGSVPDRYVETAQTLGASELQIVGKVLVPLALPDVYNSLRQLFGLAFGYIMLAEVVNSEFGLGKLLMDSQRRAIPQHVILILFIISLLAYGIDRLLLWFQRGLFPYRVAEA